MERLSVRRYEPTDADRVWEVHERALRASSLPFVEDAPADEDITRISERYLDAGGDFLVGTVAGEIVAVGGFQPREDDTAAVRRMRVHPDHQGLGYGERILEELEARVRERGFEQIALETSERLTAARRLYETRGYREDRRETHPVTGDEVIRYRKAVDAGEG